MKNWLILIFATLNLAGFSQLQISLSPASNGQTFNTCNGFIIDSGGQGGTGYSNSENTTITICPDNPDDVITITFNTFNLDPTDLLPGNPTNADVMNVYDGDNTSALFLGGYYGTDLQGTIIKATPQNATGCLTLKFVSNSTGTGMFTASVTCTTPCADPFAGGLLLNGITNDSIHVCIGEFVNFQESGSFAQMGFNLVSYKWDFMDGTTMLGQNVSHAFDDPGYYRVQLFVTDDNGCTNNNLIDLDVKVATPPNFEAFVKDTTICIGEVLGLKADPLLYENTWSSINGTTEIENGCMYDTLLGVAQNLDLVQTGFISGAVISSITDIESVCLELEHSFMGDLVISIYCPNGQSVILHQQGGGGTFLGEANDGPNIVCDDPATVGVPYEYCFSPSAAETWVDYVNASFPTILPAGDYASVEPLDQLIGCPANGIWTLSVVDNWAADDGKVFSFTLNLNPDLYGEIVEFTPQHSTPSDSSYWHYPSAFGTYLSSDADSMVITPTAAGTYVYPYTVVNDFGCSNDTSVTVTVFEVTLPFTLEDQTICSDVPFPLVPNVNNSCDYTLRLYDSWWDGWPGNELQVTIDGVTTSYSIPFDPNWGSLQLDYTINIPHGTDITFLFVDNDFTGYQCSYELIDCNGVTVFSDGMVGWNGPVLTPLNYTTDLFGGYTFAWTPAAFVDNPSFASPTAIVGSNTQFTMSYFPVDHPMCAVSDNMMATILADAYAGEDRTIDTCVHFVSADLFQYLDPAASQLGTWTDPNGDPVTMPLNLTTAMQGPYTYAVGNGTCSDQAVITNLIKSEPIIQTNYITDPHICIGDSTIFVNPNTLQNVQSIMVTYGDTSSVFDATSNYDSLFHYYPYIGTFDLTVDIVSVNGCEYHDFYSNAVSVHEYPIANFTVQPEEVSMLDPNLIVTNVSTGGIIYFNWNFQGATIDNSTNLSQHLTYPFEPGLYPVTLFVEDSVGCRDSITRMVKVNEEPLIYFPNSFTPNGDEYNQSWKISATGVVLDQFKLLIFNRWGEVIFETRDPSVGWDGTFNNQMVETGMYMWKLEAVDITRNLRFTKEGHINLLK